MNYTLRQRQRRAAHNYRRTQLALELEQALAQHVAGTLAVTVRPQQRNQTRA